MKAKVYPDRTLEDACRLAGANVACLWQIPGPKDTGILWIECLAINGGICLVQTFRGGSWNALTDCPENSIEATVADVLARVSAKRTAADTTGRPMLTMYEALAAAKARLDGEYDHPSLMKFGPLAADRMGDVRLILATCPELMGPPAAPDAAAKLREAVDAWPQFDVETTPRLPGAVDESAEVNGGDLVEWFGTWRAEVKALIGD